MRKKKKSYASIENNFCVIIKIVINMKEEKRLPEKFIELRKPLLKEDWEKFIVEYSKEASRGLQVNTLKIDSDSFLKCFDKKIEKVPYTKNSFYIEEELKAGKDPLHHAGSYYVQEPSAMIVTNSVTIPKKSIVLDVCASPGGKSVGILNQLQETGILIANEINPTRAKTLVGNIERIGAKNAIVTNFNCQQLHDLYPNTFDFIFLDTPCSGEGMFRKDDNAIQEWSEENVISCGKRSLELIDTINACLKENGYLIYSTCTFAKEENEDVIEQFLKTHHYELIEVPEEIKKVTTAGIVTTEKTDICRRFYPHTGKGEGQFVAVLRKKEKQMETANWNSALQMLSQQEKQIIFPFLEELLGKIPNHLYHYKDKIIYYPHDLPVYKYQVLSAGVTIGTIEKNRLVPHHQFFSCFGKEIKNQLNLKKEDPRVKQYLTGYEIEDNQVKDGWGVILIEGCPVGGFKATKGKLKNHYPKGLRMFTS